MNIILFEKNELGKRLPLHDPRAVHITKILGLNEGDGFTAGILGGQKGRALLESKDVNGWKVQFEPIEDTPKSYPLTIILGCPRPPVARRLLKDLSTMGIREIRVCSTDLNENSYLSAKLWHDGLWRRALIDGAMQGGSTHIPKVGIYSYLSRALENLPTGDAVKHIAFDASRMASSLSKINAKFKYAVLAVGPERGWSHDERQILTTHGFILSQLGHRILRTETACTVGVGLILSLWNIY